MIPALPVLAGLGSAAAPFISTAVGMLGNMINPQKPRTPRDEQMYQTNYTEQLTNVFALGGEMPMFTAGGPVFKQYDFKSHSEGGGKIDMNANPDPRGIAELEKQENAFRLPDGNWYIFSDRLKF